MIFTFILPKTLFFIPTQQIFLFIDNTLNEILPFNIKLRSTLFPILAPAITGQGQQSAFFILIFYQFFAMIPKSLEEAALIDGANAMQIFIRIAVPTAVPAFIITFVYGFSLYWNETFLLNFYTENKFKTILSLLANIQSNYQVPANMVNPRDPDLSFTETKRFAATILSIVPLIAFYAIVQRWFIESIDKSGITGE
jgi:multiple sugar transport system permease protein